MYEHKIGFHARSIRELERVVNIEGINLVELKPGLIIYSFDGNKFTVKKDAAKHVKELCGDRISVQIHLPYEKKDYPKTDEGLCQAIRSHHSLILARYDVVGQLLEQYGFGTVLTTHPPAFRIGKKEICSEEEALAAGVELYRNIDCLIKGKGYTFKVGVENMVAPKEVGTSSVGYKPEHIDMLIGNTSCIGITVDSGHRRLSDEMSIAKLFSYGRVVNFHFHSNSGKRSEKDYNDDEHVLATKENLPHYDRYLKSFRRFDLPVVLEIDKLEGLSDKELGAYVLNLRKEIAGIMPD